MLGYTLIAQLFLQPLAVPHSEHVFALCTYLTHTTQFVNVSIIELV